MKDRKNGFVPALLIAATSSVITIFSPLNTAGAARTAASHTYIGTKYGYSITYPGDWQKQAIQGQDLTVEAPDQNALLSVSAGKIAATLTSAVIQNLLASDLRAHGKVGPVHVTYPVIHTVKFLRLTAPVTLKNGFTLEEVLLSVQRKKIFYVVNGTWAIGLSSTAQERAEVGAGIESFMFTN